MSKAVLIGLAALVPYMLLSVPAGRICDKRDPVRVVACLFILSSAILAGVPVVFLVKGSTPLLIAIAGCCVVGGTRPFLDGAIFRAVQRVRDHDEQIRLQGMRSSLSQAGAFGGPALGLALLGIGGAPLIFGIVSLLLFLSSLTLFIFAWRVEAAPITITQEKIPIAQALAALFRDQRLRFIVILSVIWNIAAMIALSLTAPLLKSYLLLSARQSSLVIAISAVCVIVATITVSKRMVAASGSIIKGCGVAMIIEGAIFALFLPHIALSVFLIYPLFLYLIASSPLFQPPREPSLFLRKTTLFYKCYRSLLSSSATSQELC